MFDEYFNPPPSAISLVQVADTPRAVDITDSPVSTSIDQDAPSSSLTSQGSSFNVQPSHTLFELLGKWTKNHPIANVIGDPSRSVSTRKQLQTDAMWCYFNAFLTSVKPKTYKEAMLEPPWIDAMPEEIHEFERLQVWELVIIEAIHIFIANAATKNMTIYQMDVKNGFLEWLKKSLYGLKQAPCAWYDMLSSFLLSQEFSKGAVDLTLFTRKAGRDILLVQIYVDDIIFASTNLAMCDEFAKITNSKFKMSMMGQMTFFLGLQMSQSPKGIFINQSNYALEIIKKYGMLSSDPVDTPMVDKSKLGKYLQGKPVDPTHYRGMIGSLMYLTSSKPYLAFVVCMCARYQAKPTKKHLHAMQTTSGVKILDKAHLEVHNSFEINLLAGHPKSKRALLSLVQRRNILLYLECIRFMLQQCSTLAIQAYGCEIPLYYGASGELTSGTLLCQNRISTCKHLHKSFATRKIQLLGRKAGARIDAWDAPEDLESSPPHYK
ncbi:retrovirus-related pol polyprotein from transposon TNT 1-94 [Tanacetum coccineum]